MNRLVRRVVLATTILLPLIAVAPTAASSAPSLTFREIKITGNEFIVLQNTGTADIASLSDYWLGYVSDDASSAVAAFSQQLPAVSLAVGQAMLLTGNGAQNVCDASYVVKLSSSLSDTRGTLALWQQNGTTFSELTDPNQLVKWTSSSTVPTGEINIKQEAAPISYTNPVWYYSGTSWVVANADGCSLTTFSSPGDTVGTTAVSWPDNNIDPPAIIESLSGNETGPVLPVGDIGLNPPIITELLPNPTGTGNDGSEEFIELYNPNDADFDLAGFTLQTGIATAHNYIFPNGTMLPPNSFTAFYSSTTGLTLSNTSSQAVLFDPFGTILSQTDPYSSAKDGQAWALAKGMWYYTSMPTPNELNDISQPTSSIKTTTTKQAVAAVKGASTTRSSLGTTGSTSDEASQSSSKAHPYVLVAIGAVAVGYIAYEYRHDIANKIYQLRANRKAG